MQDIGSKWLAVVNPFAGSGKTLWIWERAFSRLRSKGVDCEVRMTGQGANVMEIVVEEAGGGFRNFLSVGGDGTLHDLIDGIMAFIGRAAVSLSDFTIAAIPIGSGNDWIRSHGIPHDVEAVVDLIAAGSFSMQDVVKVSALQPAESSVSYMMNVGGVGFDSRICKQVNIWKKEGRSGRLLYIKSLIYNIFHCKPTSVEVICDGSVAFSGPCYSIAFGNGLYSGGGLRQTPLAVMDDGLLDVTVIPVLPLMRILREVPKLLSDKILTVPEITACKARSVVVRPLGEAVPAGAESVEAEPVEIKSVEAEPVEVDGEIVGSIPVRLDVLPDQIRVLHNPAV